MESDIKRIPLKGAAEGEGGGKIVFGSFTCEDVRLMSADGGSGLVYQGVSRDYYDGANAAPARLIIKECYPLDIAPFIRREGDELSVVPGAPRTAQEIYDAYLQRFKDSFARHTALYQGYAREQVSVPSRAYSKNGTMYIVSDASNGMTLDRAIEFMPVEVQVRVLKRLCEVISAIHQSGFVYLDLKPSNVIAVQSVNSGETPSFTGDVRLFDFDTVTAIDEIAMADVIVGSGSWAAYEQTHFESNDLIGIRSDFYSIGAILFWMLVGRAPTPNEVIHAQAHWQIEQSDITQSAFSKLDARTLQLVKRVLSHTLAVDPQARYESDELLLHDVENLEDAVSPFNSAVLNAMEQLKGDINQNVREVVREESSKGKRRRKPIVIAVVVVLLCALFGIGSYFGCRALKPDVIVGHWDIYAMNYEEGPAQIDPDSNDATMELDIYKDGTATLGAEDAFGDVMHFDWKLDKVGLDDSSEYSASYSFVERSGLHYQFMVYHVTASNSYFGYFVLPSQMFPHPIFIKTDGQEG